MQQYSTSILQLGKNLRTNANLIATLAKREVASRYKGSMLGLFWSFITPLFILVVYTFIFSVVFKARWNVGSNSKTEFALVLFAGLMVYNFFSECLNRAPSLILSNVNYVKKVVFPLEVLPIIAVFSALFTLLISLAVWFLAYILLFGIPHLTALWLPILLIPLVLYILGFSWFFSSLGVYLRDVTQLIGLLTTMLMFLTPIFFPLANLPPKYQQIMKLNPLTAIIESVRDVLMWGKQPDFNAIALSLVMSILVAWLGYYWFQKTRKGFADVL
jgi:lipopolysaccharide transport system permease protein